MTTPVDYDFETATITTEKFLHFPRKKLTKVDEEELHLASLASPLITPLENGKSVVVTFEPDPKQPIPSVLSNKLSLDMFHLLHSAAGAGFTSVVFEHGAKLPELKKEEEQL